MKGKENADPSPSSSFYSRKTERRCKKLVIPDVLKERENLGEKSGSRLGEATKKSDREADFTGLSALNDVIEEEQKDGIEITLEAVDVDNIPLNPSHTVGLIPESKVSLKDLSDFPLDVDKKKELDRDIVELKTILKERHGYSLDVDLGVNTLWNMKKAEFLDGSVTAYFSEDSKPVFFLGSSIAVMQAPRIEEE